MHTIYKYPINAAWAAHGGSVLELPYLARVLSVQYQEGTGLCLWALVDPEAVKVLRKIHIYGTGWPADGCLHLDYLTTVQDSGGFVWHVFITPGEGHHAEV